ncbi:hypothetical protein BDN70DRAFT_441427 [Pholiota conissans]|uniref:Uncharacterized protein n=1 Tax=Pholiota conissans TaxID=109636 RepID=A0A9P6CT62_9AGAR|nr:hypothetical protein BDN70DRAFT_441427 [Pholiota conissans]
MLTSRIGHDIYEVSKKADFRLPFQSCFLRLKERASIHAEHTSIIELFHSMVDIHLGGLQRLWISLAVPFYFIFYFYTFYHRTSARILFSMPLSRLEDGTLNNDPPLFQIRDTIRPVMMGPQDLNINVLTPSLTL